MHIIEFYQEEPKLQRQNPYQKKGKIDTWPAPWINQRADVENINLTGQ